MPVIELSYVLVSDQPQPPGGQQQGSRCPPAPVAAGPPEQPQQVPPARYTRSLLRQTLQLMGQKPRQSDKAAQKAFLILQQRAALPPSEPLSLAARLDVGAGDHAGVNLTRSEFDRLVMDCLVAAAPPPAADAAVVTAGAAAAGAEAGELQQEQEGVAAVEQQEGVAAVEQRAQPPVSQVQQQEQLVHLPPALQQQQQQQQQGQEDCTQQTAQPPAASARPCSPPLLSDFHIACSLREQRTSVAVLLCGTSGTGKSTLAALLAARLGISTVVSTDSLRHMMRSFSSEVQDPLLWASTYQAGTVLQQLQAEAQAGGAAGAAAQRTLAGYAAGWPAGPAAGDARKAAVRGYKLQSGRVLEHVDRLLSGCEARRQSVVVEGVHLSLSMVVRMMQRHPSVVPFLVHISNETKHMERFAVRSKVMTLRPDGNRYVKYFRNIRAIQDYLAKSADKHAIPKVDNTNVDRSVATIHTTVLGCLRRTARGESVLTGTTLNCKLLLEEYLRCQSATWSSRDMLELLRRKSARGLPPSPSDVGTSAATATATATMPASTPRGPLSEAAVEDLLWPARGRASGDAGPCEGEQQEEEAADGQEGRRGAGDNEDEGDNRSFYGSESQSSSQGAEGSTSCSCSEEEEGEEAGEAGGAHVEADGAWGGATGRPHGSAAAVSNGRGGLTHLPTGESRETGALGLLRRPRGRRRVWRGGSSGGGSAVGEIASGPVPEFMRRRSEVGSVLEPEPQSDTEDAELALATLAVHA